MIALVVDDSRTARRVVGRVLRRAGMDVLEAGDGREALAVLDAHVAAGGEVPTLACIDWNMPVMDGLGLVGALRRRREMRATALVMVTSETEQRQVVRALAAGAHDYVRKPSTEEELLERLRLLGVLAPPATVRSPAWG
ncbi:response regulator [Pseudokineococcus basanitobsidens]|uniref:Response regulator n=1 Tax=Pseudokineococcus basanitobsidens TaxID=1926649 RepID=A0ABU8RG23_9ACTN